MPLIPEHLGGGSKLPEPLPKRPADDKTCPATVCFIAKIVGGEVVMYDWMPKTNPMGELQAHVGRLQSCAPKGQKFVIIEYKMESIHD